MSRVTEEDKERFRSFKWDTSGYIKMPDIRPSQWQPIEAATRRKMTVYKPGTQLILTDLWAAAAADKLGFEVETFDNSALNELSHEWVNSFLVCDVDFGGSLTEFTKWRITVNESGPNAAERFLPQMRDYIISNGSLLEVDDFEASCGINGFISLKDAIDLCDDMDNGETKRGVPRIIERNNTPFPQFSEVIEP